MALNNKENSFNKEIDYIELSKANTDIYNNVLSNFVSNPNSIYHHTLKSCVHGDIIFDDIKNYLLSSKNYKSNSSKDWPKYIKDIIKDNNTFKTHNKFNIPG